MRCCVMLRFTYATPMLIFADFAADFSDGFRAEVMLLLYADSYAFSLRYRRALFSAAILLLC